MSCGLQSILAENPLRTKNLTSSAAVKVSKPRPDTQVMDEITVTLHLSAQRKSEGKMDNI